jgi:hypothetical protein
VSSGHRNLRQSPTPVTDWKKLYGLLALLGAVILLWDTPLVYPLKILVVFFHELSHAVMALLTGGSVVRIELDALQGGLCVTRGGNAFLIASAGYLGSLLWGGTILLLTQRYHNDRLLSMLLSILLVAVCLIWIRPVLGFGAIFCLLAGAGLFWCSLKLSHQANALLLRIVGLTSLLYAPLDIVSDTLVRHNLHSDARTLEQITLIPGVIWGVLWCAVSLVLAMWFLRAAARPGPQDA